MHWELSLSNSMNGMLMPVFGALTSIWMLAQVQLVVFLCTLSMPQCFQVSVVGLVLQKIACLTWIRISNQKKEQASSAWVLLILSILFGSKHQLNFSRDLGESKMCSCRMRSFIVTLTKNYSNSTLRSCLQRTSMSMEGIFPFWLIKQMKSSYLMHLTSMLSRVIRDHLMDKKLSSEQDWLPCTIHCKIVMHLYKPLLLFNEET